MVKEQDLVARKSYGEDIVFVIDKIINNIAILKGVTVRIEADAPINDLVHVTKERQEECFRTMDERINCLANDIKNSVQNKRELENNEIEYTGTILHLDGDKRYTNKSIKYYKQLGLKAIVKNIPEKMQAEAVLDLLKKYNPDILVITGHDSMIKKGTDYNNINNYRNSKYFINAVRQARRWRRTSRDLVIFAGACQSFFEAIMLAGADFASSPRKDFNRFC